MKLMGELNDQEKITIVIVTHEPDIAARAKRQIKMIDGCISES
jgi:putative ABC transport system ATP-binding protein